jgi:ankyrin repeat protein
MLLNAGAAPAKDQQLLPWAAKRKNRDVLLALIKAGADLNERATLSEFNSKTGKHVTYCDNATALIIAAAGGAEEIVRDLIEAGADLYAKDATGAMAVDLARQKKHAGVISLLESATAQRPRKDPTGDLIFAAEKGDTALVKELLAAGANANARDSRPQSKGFTPLILAARCGHDQTVAALLDGGANLALKDDAEAGNEAGFNFIFNEGGIEQVIEAGKAVSQFTFRAA